MTRFNRMGQNPYTESRILPLDAETEQLAPMDNHLEAIGAATRFQHALKLQSVFSYLVAIPLSSLIFAK